jgi:predicted nucleic acid-binding protein
MGLALYDSTFFVDLDRERRRKEEGPATCYLKERADEEMAMSVVTQGELARGFKKRADWEAFCAGVLVLPLSVDCVWLAAELFRNLRKRGVLVSDNDLWIGATALFHGLPLVTENARHFTRMPKLKVIRYGRG